MKKLLFSLALLQLVGCAALDPNDVLLRGFGNGAPPAGVALTATEREQAFDFVWNRINDRYIDPTLHGLDWRAIGAQFRPQALRAGSDDAFWSVLDKMVAELGDAHTRVLSSRQYAAFKNKEAHTLGLNVREIGPDLVVVTVRPESAAQRAGIMPGNRVIAIDGQAGAQWWQATLAQARKNSTDRARNKSVLRVLNAGDLDVPKDNLLLRVERNDGSLFDPDLIRAALPVKESVRSKILPSGDGYFRLTGFDARLQGEIDTALAQVKAAPGIVIDLRGNGGGSLALSRSLLGQFFSGRTAAGKTITRSGKPVSILFGLIETSKPEFEVMGSPKSYRGPLVVLVDDGSASASELTTATLQGLGRAKVVGEPSCGCLLGYLGYANVPGGGALAYSELDFETVGGKRIEGVGVIPDLTVPVTRADLIAGRDAQLEAAVALLGRMRAQSAAPAVAAGP